MSVPIGNAGAAVPAASAGPSLACYGSILLPALLHALTAGLVQRGGSARLTKKKIKEKKKEKNLLYQNHPPNPSLQPADRKESCCCSKAEAGTRVWEGRDLQPTLRWI